MDLKGVEVVGEVLHLTLLMLLKRLELARYLLSVGLVLARYLLPIGLLRGLLPGPQLGQLGL